MKVIFCDLCGSPIKEIKWTFHITKRRIDNGYSGYIEKEENKDICDNCKEIINNIFEKRMKGVLKLGADLKTIYDIPVKKNKRKNA